MSGGTNKIYWDYFSNAIPICPGRSLERVHPGHHTHGSSIEALNVRSEKVVVQGSEDDPELSDGVSE